MLFSLSFFMLAFLFTASDAAPQRALTRVNASKNLAAPGVPHAPQGVNGFKCATRQNTQQKIPVADAKVALNKACSQSKNKNQITNFPTQFRPGLGQRFSFQSSTYFLNPVNEAKYPGAFIVMSQDCGLAGMMTAKKAVIAGLPGSQGAVQAPAARPANSVRTRPTSPVPQSVRTRPAAALGAAGVATNSRQAAQSVRTRPQSNLKIRDDLDQEEILNKRASLVPSGGDFNLCTAQTYDWDGDISGNGRPINSIPNTAGRVPI